MTPPINIILATTVLGVGLGAAGAVYAADNATANKCWGLATKEFAPLGGHASSQDTPRRGVGRVSEQDFDTELSDGAQGVHAANVAPDPVLESLPEECQELETPETP